MMILLKNIFKWTFVSAFSLSILSAYGNDDSLILNESLLIQKALTQSFRVQIENIRSEISGEGIQEALGVYDPVLTASSVVIESYDDDYDGENQTTLGLEGKLPTATSYTIASSYSSNNPTVDRSSSSVSLQIRQPLLRDVFGQVTRQEIRVARTSYDMSREDLAGEVSDTIADVLNAYYDACAAKEYYEITLQTEAIINELLSANRERVKLGAISPSDILQAESELLIREVEREDASRVYYNRLNQIRSLISAEVESILDLNIDIIPPTVPEYEKKNHVNAVKAAFEQRPDLQKALLAVKKSHIEGVIAKNESLPEVDLVAGVNWSDINYSEEHTDFQENTAHLGLSFSWPVPNRSYLAERRKAQAKIRQSQLSLRELQQSIYLELDNSIRNIETQWKRLQKARKARALAEASVEAEEEKFESGNSSTFIILRLQDDLASARVSEIFIKNAYLKALVDYDHKTGSDFSKFNVSI